MITKFPIWVSKVVIQKWKFLQVWASWFPASLCCKNPQCFKTLKVVISSKICWMTIILNLEFKDNNLCNPLHQLSFALLLCKRWFKELHEIYAGNQYSCHSHHQMSTDTESFLLEISWEIKENSQFSTIHLRNSCLIYMCM